jgi:hypothetical protein
MPVRRIFGCKFITENVVVSHIDDVLLLSMEGVRYRAIGGVLLVRSSLDDSHGHSVVMNPCQECYSARIVKKKNPVYL